MRFYVNPSNLLFFIAGLSTSTNTTEEFKGYLQLTVSSMMIDVIYQISPGKSFQEIYPLLNWNILNVFFRYRMLRERAKHGKSGTMLVIKKEKKTLFLHTRRKFKQG